jgi:hypothetical protein
MQIIYKNNLAPKAIQLMMLPLWLFNTVGASTFVNMVKNNDYLDHPFILFFITLFFLILLLSPQTIVITPKYIIRKYSFLPFLKKTINFDNITKISYFPNDKNQNLSSITIKTKPKDISINIGNYFVNFCPIPELRHANIAQSIAYLSQLNINTTNHNPPIIEGYFYQHLSKKPTLKNSRYRFVLACGLLTILSISFWMLGKAHFPALQFDKNLTFIFIIFIISALIAFLTIKESPKDEYISNHFTAILFGLMMSLASYSFINNFSVMYGQVELVTYQLTKNTENNQEWQPINSSNSPIISTPYQSKKPLHSKQKIHIYTGILD